MPRSPFLVFSLASFFFFFFFLGILLAFTQLHFLFLSIWQTSIFPRWICISPWYPFILSNALSFFLTWLYTLFWWNVSYFLFSSSSSIWLNFFSWWIFIFAHSSQLELSFMESLVSCVFWWISIFLQLDENSYIHFSLFFFFFFFVEVFSSLMAISFSHSLMLSQNLISSWWISFLPSFDELSFLILMNLPLLNFSYCLHWGPYQVVLDP